MSTKNVTITQQDDRIIVGVGGQIRTLDFSDGHATLAIFAKGYETALVALEFTNDVPTPRATTNHLTLDVTLPKAGGGE